MEWLVQAPILLFSIMFHEVSHGWTALRHGDDTALRAGRLTFNPVDHVDPVGTILLPLISILSHVPLIGWAKPVPVNPSRLRGAATAMIRVALAGPLSNLLLAAGAALVFKAVASVPLGADLRRTALEALVFAVQINVYLAVFNLIPVYPLDGSKVLGGLLPWRWRRAYDSHNPYGFMIIMALMAFGILGPLVARPSMLIVGLFARMGLF